VPIGTVYSAHSHYYCRCRCRCLGAIQGFGSYCPPSGPVRQRFKPWPGNFASNGTYASPSENAVQGPRAIKTAREASNHADQQSSCPGYKRRRDRIDRRHVFKVSRKDNHTSLEGIDQPMGTIAQPTSDPLSKVNFGSRKFSVIPMIPPNQQMPVSIFYDSPRWANYK
jgi:hypothetical protein